jgi:hypothetical protein
MLTFAREGVAAALFLVFLLGALKHILLKLIYMMEVITA